MSISPTARFRKALDFVIVASWFSTLEAIHSGIDLYITKYGISGFLQIVLARNKKRVARNMVDPRKHVTLVTLNQKHHLISHNYGG